MRSNLARVFVDDQAAALTFYTAGLGFEPRSDIPLGNGDRWLTVGTPGEPVVIVATDGRNRSRFEWVHVVRITTRPKRVPPTIVELSDRDAPLTGRAMTDELELVHKDDLEECRQLGGFDRAVIVSPARPRGQAPLGRDVHRSSAVRSQGLELTAASRISKLRV